MPTDLEEVSKISVPLNDTCCILTRALKQLVDFLHHGNTQIRQIGKVS